MCECKTNGSMHAVRIKSRTMRGALCQQEGSSYGRGGKRHTKKVEKGTQRRCSQRRNVPDNLKESGTCPFLLPSERLTEELSYKNISAQRNPQSMGGGINHKSGNMLSKRSHSSVKEDCFGQSPWNGSDF